MKTILMVLFIFFFLLYSIPFHGIMYLVGLKHPEKREMCTLRTVQWAFSVCTFISGIDYTVIGRENIPTDEPALYVGNHRGFFDVIQAYQLFPNPTGFVAKTSIKNVPLLSWYMKRLHCTFIDREDIKQSLKVILECIDNGKKGISTCIFPEGTRCKDQNPIEMGEFKEGSFKIAAKTGMKIVPIATIGTNKVLEDQMPWVKKGKVVMEIGEPIDIKSLDPEDQKFVGAYTERVIRDMLAKNYEKYYK